MTAKTAFVFLAAFSSTGALVGCSGSGSNQPADPDPSTVRASLHRSKGCTDLLSDFKADAKYKVNRGINRQIDSINKCIAAVGDANCAYGGYALGGVPPEAASDSNESGSSSGGTSAPTSAGSAGDKASSYSDTNTQVKGVDEADIVKTDGTSLFVLHGNALKVVKAWPVADLKEATSTPIEGYPSEMFVNAGKAVIYSTVNGYSIYGQAGVAPKDTYYDWGYGYAGGVDALAMPSYPGGGYSSGPYVPLTKVTVLDLTGAAPAVTREMYFEGGYLDARRVDNHVRTVFTGAAHGPKLIYSVYELYPNGGGESTPGYDPTTGSSSSSSGSSSGSSTNPYPQTGTAMIAALEQMRSKNLASIDASQLDDWLPYTFVKNGSAVQAKSVACEDFYMPSLGSSDAGLTEVVSFDLANPASLPKETAIAAAADTVYGSADTLYLASRAWIEPPFAWQYYGGVNGTTASPPPSTAGGSSGQGTATPPVDAPPPVPGTKSLPVRTTPTQVIAWTNEKTHLHKFEFKTDATFPNYLASGTVFGAIKDQFSMDDKDGNLRISTTESRSYFDLSGQYVSDSTGSLPYNVNHVFVLGQNGTWLDKIGDVGDLAPNERIYSTRFIGNRGYVTTFRQVDPLFVFDLSNPAAPTKLAELTIPGFSEYMHPLDDTHLLTIGRDASSTGQANGLQLRIFDVADGAHPKVVQQYTYSNLSYGSSDAEYDHKAFTYFEDKKLLAFPFYSYNGNGTSGSTLEVFAVDAANGFTKVGSVDSSTLISKAPQGYCGGYYGPSVRRGVFLENWVYSVSYAGIVAKDASNMAATGYSIPLEDPQTNEGYGPVCAYAE